MKLHVTDNIWIESYLKHVKQVTALMKTIIINYIL